MGVSFDSTFWGSVYRSLPDLIFLALCLLVHALTFRSCKQIWAKGALIASAVWIAFCVLGSFPISVVHLPRGGWMYWMRGIGHLWGLATLGALVAWLVAGKLESRFSPSRRVFLSTARAAMIAAPAVVTGYGVMGGRLSFGVKEIDIPVRDLPKDLNGFRILQLSDIHMSPFLTGDDLMRVIDMANETKPHLAVVTGDFITGPHDPLEECVEHLSRLKADHGVLGCNGNHEIFAKAEALAQKLCAREGIRILRQQSTKLRIGGTTLNIAGVDYQQFRQPYLVGAESLVDPEAFNILLSHNPDVFPVAAKKGYQLTLAGHTHGGQVTVEILHQYVNAARIFTPYVSGRYEKEGSSLYVTRGIGTVGIPARLGALPEISVIRLCAS
jgi:predicted MPP superfamily phosphohydrolase